MDFSRKDFLKLSGLATLSGISFTAKAAESASHSVPDLIKAPPVKAGDTLSLIAPASPIYDDSDFEQMLTDLRNLGFNLKLGKHVKKQRGYLAGTDEERAADLMDAFRDPETDGIICVRGGWGCNRILPLIDFNVISSHPKFFMGFSDITSLHLSIYKHTGLVTFHGPVGKSKWTDITLGSFKDVAWNGERADYLIPEDHEAYTIESGTAEGRLLGGNLTVLAAMVGSDYLPSFENSILFLEDVGESVYRIDRMLTQLKLAGILDQISGFVFGKCTACDSGSNSLSLQQVFEDHISPLKIPAYYGALISHEDDNVTLPVGTMARMDAGNRSLRLLESGVS